jgi:hypothetical protein
MPAEKIRSFCLCSRDLNGSGKGLINEWKTAVTSYIRNISQADLQKLFVNKIKLVQACLDARGYDFQHIL